MIESVTSKRGKILLPLLLVAITTLLVVGACTFLAPKSVPMPTPTPTPTQIDPGALIGGVINPAGTIWTGKDSGGDQSTFVLKQDGSVAVTYASNGYVSPGDKWSVQNGELHMSIYLDEANGTAEYLGTWDPATKTLNTTMKTSKTGKELTVTLTQVG